MADGRYVILATTPQHTHLLCKYIMYIYIHNAVEIPHEFKLKTFFKQIFILRFIVIQTKRVGIQFQLN